MPRASQLLHPERTLVPPRPAATVLLRRDSAHGIEVLMTRRGDGSAAGAGDIASLERSAPFLAQCQARDLLLAADEVFVLAHWITDRDLPRRFDVPFLVAHAGTPDSGGQRDEQFESVWVRPGGALARHQAGGFFIIFPTIRTLERLMAYPNPDAMTGPGTNSYLVGARADQSSTQWTWAAAISRQIGDTWTLADDI